MRTARQIAQKLHAVSGAGISRAHDLVDLQLIVMYEQVDYAAVRKGAAGTVADDCEGWRMGRALPRAGLEGLNVLLGVGGAIERATSSSGA